LIQNSVARMNLRCGSDVLTIDVCCAGTPAEDIGNSLVATRLGLLHKQAVSEIFVAFPRIK
jgi:hypothetical protein